jgi:hypothetical protein
MNTKKRLEPNGLPRRIRQARVVELVFRTSVNEPSDRIFQIIGGGLARLIASKIAIEVGADIEFPSSGEKAPE